MSCDLLCRYHTTGYYSTTWGSILVSQLVNTVPLLTCGHPCPSACLEELSLTATLDREDLAQSYMVADKESQDHGLGMLVVVVAKRLHEARETK